MRALSIRQPWLWAILEGGKRVENRDWASCSYRGPILLHASKGCTRDEYEDASYSIVDMRDDLRRHGELGPELIPIPPLKEQPRGVLLGIASIVHVVRHPEYPSGYRGYRVAGALGLELADVRRLPPVPFKGMLGFFNVFLAGLEHAETYKAAWDELAAKAGCHGA